MDHLRLGVLEELRQQSVQTAWDARKQNETGVEVEQSITSSLLKHYGKELASQMSTMLTHMKIRTKQIPLHIDEKPSPFIESLLGQPSITNNKNNTTNNNNNVRITTTSNKSSTQSSNTNSSTTNPNTINTQSNQPPSTPPVPLSPTSSTSSLSTNTSQINSNNNNQPYSYSPPPTSRFAVEETDWLTRHMKLIPRISNVPHSVHNIEYNRMRFEAFLSSCLLHVPYHTATITHVAPPFLQPMWGYTHASFAPFIIRYAKEYSLINLTTSGTLSSTGK